MWFIIVRAEDLEDAHDEIVRLQQQIMHLSDELHNQRNQRSVLDNTKSMRRLTILHFNDVYAYEAGSKEPVGGASRMSTLVKTFKDENPLVINSGDILGPSITSNCTHGSHMIEILNLIPVVCYGGGLWIYSQGFSFWCENHVCMNSCACEPTPLTKHNSTTASLAITTSTSGWCLPRAS